MYLSCILWGFIELVLHWSRRQGTREGILVGTVVPNIMFIDICQVERSTCSPIEGDQRSHIRVILNFNVSNYTDLKYSVFNKKFFSMTNNIQLINPLFWDIFKTVCFKSSYHFSSLVHFSSFIKHSSDSEMHIWLFGRFKMCTWSENKQSHKLVENK